MRIGIDVRPALRRKTGVGRYLCGLVPALIREGHEVVAFSSSLRDRLDPATFPGATVVDRRVPVRTLDWLWGRGAAPTFERLAGPIDIVHSPTPLPIPSRGAARVTTIHDLFFLREPRAAAGAVGRDWIPQARRAVALADAVICVSQSAAHDAIALLGAAPQKLHVVHHGLEPGWLDPLPEGEDDAVLGRLGLGAPFLLAVGALEVRKNYPRLVSAFDRLRRTSARAIDLVLAGPDGADREAIERLAARLDLTGALRLVGYQDDGTLKTLYHRAIGLVMPSLDEGFGFPVLEAMASGCALLAARAGALPEVAGDAALYVDPLEEESIFEGLHALCRGGRERERRRAIGLERARQFRWDTAAQATAHAYRAALAARDARAAPQLRTTAEAR